MGSPGFLDDDVSTLDDGSYSGSDDDYPDSYVYDYQGADPDEADFAAEARRFSDGSADEGFSDALEGGLENDYDGDTADRKDGTQ